MFEKTKNQKLKEDNLRLQEECNKKKAELIMLEKQIKETENKKVQLEEYIENNTLPALENELLKIDAMKGTHFEKYIAEVLRANKYTNIEVTSKSNDEGVDIFAYKDGKKYCFQCKRSEKKISNKAIQEIYTAEKIYNCSYAGVITNNYFTKPAIRTAESTGVILIDRDNLSNLLEKYLKLDFNDKEKNKEVNEDNSDENKDKTMQILKIIGFIILVIVFLPIAFIIALVYSAAKNTK